MLFRNVLKKYKDLTWMPKDSWEGMHIIEVSLKKDIPEDQRSQGNKGVKRCKRCGGTAEVTGDKYQGYAVECKQCDNQFDGSDDKKMTISIWNKQNN